MRKRERRGREIERETDRQREREGERGGKTERKKYNINKQADIIK